MGGSSNSLAGGRAGQQGLRSCYPGWGARTGATRSHPNGSIAMATRVVNKLVKLLIIVVNKLADGCYCWG